MKTITLDFCDFPPGFSKTDNFFYRFLSQRFCVDLYDKPDFLIYSDYGHKHRLYSCPKIYYTGECWSPDFSVCDYALTFFRIGNERHFRLPIYVLDTDPSSLEKGTGEAEQILSEKTNFCCFVVGYSDRTVAKRSNFFHLLSQYKRVDSGGRGLNNIGGPIASGWTAKLEFLRPYKFHICFENNSVPGYTTEKLVHAMQARCLPVYWGDPLVGSDFNPRSFLDLADFSGEDEMIRRIIEIDNDDSQYLQYMRESYYNADRNNPLLHPERLEHFFETVFANPVHPVVSRKRSFSPGRWTFAKRDKMSG